MIFDDIVKDDQLSEVVAIQPQNMWLRHYDPDDGRSGRHYDRKMIICSTWHIHYST